MSREKHEKDHNLTCVCVWLRGDSAAPIAGRRFWINLPDLPDWNLSYFLVGRFRQTDCSESQQWHVFLKDVV